MPSHLVTVLGANSSSAPRPKLAQPSARPNLSAGFSELGPVSMTFGSPGERADSEAFESRKDIKHLLRGLEHDLDAAVLLVAELAVHLGAFGQRHLVGDDEAGIDLLVLDAVEQIVGPPGDVALAHAEGQALVQRHAPRDLVAQAAVTADDRDHARRAANVDHLAQH